MSATSVKAAALAVAAVCGLALAQSDFFDTRVAPILSVRCLGCHNNQLKDGGISFLDRDSLLKGGTRGPAIVPGKPEAGVLMLAVRQDGALMMPPGGKLAAAEIATLARWIAMGAPWGTKLRPPPSEVWRFDSVEKIAGHPTSVLGHPRVIETPVGRAVEFNGVDDAIYVDVHPLAGAAEFTWEVWFRPDAGGGAEQRFFHLQEQGAGGEDTVTRMLFEIRVIGAEWCLDSFVKTGAAERTLLNRERLHPLGAWYHAAMVYDGVTFRNYVDGVMQGAGPLRLAVPQGAGHSSIGVRINRRDYFKGAVALARFTRAALAPEEFLRPPVK